MKKTLILLFTAALLTSCAKLPPTELDTQHDILPPSKTEFSSNGELPDIGKFSGNQTPHFYGEYTADFIPNDEYGTLIPFVSSYKIYSESSESVSGYEYCTYGLCTTDGRIVMDAPQNTNEIYAERTDDGFEYYTLSFYENTADDSYIPTKSLLIPKDGSWSIEIPYYGWVSYVGGGIICIRYNSCIRTPDNEDGIVMDIYGYDGKKINGIYNLNVVNGYSCGMLATSHWEDGVNSSYFMDLYAGNVMGPYAYIDSFSQNGIAPVTDINGDSYLIDLYGDRLTDKSYTDIYRKTSDDGKIEIYVATHAHNPSARDVLDANGEYMFTVDAENMVDFCFTDGEIMYCCLDTTRSKRLWKKADGTDLVSKEYGVAPNQYPFSNDIFIHIDEESKTGLLFDHNGDTIALIDDFTYIMAVSPDGKYIAYSSGGYNPETEVDNYALNVYDVEAKKTLFTRPDYGYITFTDDSRYAAVTIYAAVDVENGGHSVCSLYDLEKKEFVLEGLRSLNVVSADGKTFFNVCRANSCILYDQELNTMIKKYFE